MRHEVNLEGKRNQKLAALAKPSFEQAEEIRGLFVGETRIPPIWCLFPPMILLAIFISRGGVIAVTNRNVYQFSLGPLGRWKQLLHKTRLGEAIAVEGRNWSLKIGKGPTLYATPGNGRGVQSDIAALINTTNPVAPS